MRKMPVFAAFAKVRSISELVPLAVFRPGDRRPDSDGRGPDQPFLRRIEDLGIGIARPPQDRVFPEDATHRQDIAPRVIVPFTFDPHRLDDGWRQCGGCSRKSLCSFQHVATRVHELRHLVAVGLTIGLRLRDAECEPITPRQ